MLGIFALIVLLGCPVMLHSRALHQSADMEGIVPNFMIPENQPKEDRIPALSTEQQDQPFRGRRAATSIKTFLWNEGIIPYEFSPGVMQDNRVRGAIQAAMAEWMKYTCIRFVPYKAGTFTDYLNFTTSPGRSCSADVGRMGGRQDVKIASGCWPLPGVAMHELGHSIGFWHEHTRPDRDCYIEILKENLDTDFKENFRKRQRQEIDSFGIPYDLDSIMHYGLTAFSKNKLPTIRVRGNYSGHVGQRNVLSDKDILQANLLYNCQAMTKRLPHGYNGVIQNGNTVALRIEEGSIGLSHNWLRCDRDEYCIPTQSTCAGYHFDDTDWNRCNTDTFRIFSLEASGTDDTVLVGDTVILQSGDNSNRWLSCQNGLRSKCKTIVCDDAFSNLTEPCPGIRFKLLALGLEIRDALKDQHVIGLQSTSNATQWMSCKNDRPCRMKVCSTRPLRSAEHPGMTNCPDAQFTITKRGNNSFDPRPAPRKGTVAPVDCSVNRE